MKTIRAHNGELVALVLAGGCAWLIATSVLHLGAGSPDAIHLPVLAATAAVVTTWVLWRLLAAYGTRLVLTRAAIAGGLAGVLAHPVFMFLVVLRDAIAACPDKSCMAGAVLTLDGLSLAAAGSAVFSVFGLAITGPVTVPVGVLGGILAVVLSGARGRSGGTAPSDTDDSSVGQRGSSTRLPGV